MTSASVTATATQSLSATPVVLLAGALLATAIILVLVVSFYLHRRSDRRTPPRS